MPFIRNSAGIIVSSDDNASKSYRFGNISGGNYLEIESDGFDSRTEHTK